MQSLGIYKNNENILGQAVVSVTEFIKHFGLDSTPNNYGSSDSTAIAAKFLLLAKQMIPE